MAKTSTPHEALVLASQSPRRREILSALAYPFRIIPSNIVEKVDEAIQEPSLIAEELALTKAQEVTKQAGDTLVLGADTMVVLEGKVMGKPMDVAEAKQMLSALRGREHRVITGIAVVNGLTGSFVKASKETLVLIRDYSDDEVEAYVASGDPMDKAGAYAVQDSIFRPAALVKGCHLNVVGLPLCDVSSILETFGLPIKLRRNWNPPSGCVDCPLQNNVEGNRL